YWTMQDSMSLTGSLLVNNGSLDTSASNYLVTVASDAILFDTFNGHTSSILIGGNYDDSFCNSAFSYTTMTFTATSAKTLSTCEGFEGNAIFNSTSGSWTVTGGGFNGVNTVTAGTVTLTGNAYFSCTGISINGGTLILNTCLDVYGNW